MKLIVGLGNPGKKYEQTRHNVGFMAIDALAHYYNFAPFRSKFQGDISEGTINNIKLLLLKPSTYMNNSGRSVAETCRFYKIPLEDIYVIHDELDLKENQIRVKQGGGHGGHNGLRDIDSHIGKNYHRIRYGINHPGDKDQVTDYVLSNFTNGEKTALNKSLDYYSESFPLLLTEGADAFMTKYALKMNPPTHTPKPTNNQTTEQPKEG